MKKLLKNASLLLITLVFSFGFIKSVYADCSGAAGGSGTAGPPPAHR